MLSLKNLGPQLTGVETADELSGTLSIAELGPQQVSLPPAHTENHQAPFPREPKR